MLSQRLIIGLHEADHFDAHWSISLANTIPERLRFGLYRGANRLLCCICKVLRSFEHNRFQALK